MTPGNRSVLLVSHVTPTLGLERCALRLASATGLGVVAIGDDPQAASLAAGETSVQCLGTPLRGIGRVRSMWRVWKWLRQEKHDQIVACGLWAALPLLVLLPHRRGKRVIVWEHSLTRGKLDSSRSLRLLGRLARLLYQTADEVVAVSTELAVEIQTWLDKVVVRTIPNFLPTAGRTPNPDVAASSTRTGILILSVGSLTTTKNHAVLVRAMALLPDDTHLLILGEGPTRPTLEQLITQLGLGDRIAMPGYIEDPTPHFASAGIVVHPALGETFGLALFEAAAHHVPVLTLEYALTKTLVPRYVPGQLVDNDPNALANGVLRIRDEQFPDEVWLAADAAREQDYSDDRILTMWSQVLSGDFR